MKKAIIAILIGVFCISPWTSLKAGVNFGQAMSSAVIYRAKGHRKPHASSAVTVRLEAVKERAVSSSSVRIPENIVFNGELMPIAEANHKIQSLYPGMAFMFNALVIGNRVEIGVPDPKEKVRDHRKITRPNWKKRDVYRGLVFLNREKLEVSPVFNRHEKEYNTSDSEDKNKLISKWQDELIFIARTLIGLGVPEHSINPTDIFGITLVNHPKSALRPGFAKMKSLSDLAAIPTSLEVNESSDSPSATSSSPVALVNQIGDSFNKDIRVFLDEAKRLHSSLSSKKESLSAEVRAALENIGTPINQIVTTRRALCARLDKEALEASGNRRVLLRALSNTISHHMNNAIGVVRRIPGTCLDNDELSAENIERIGRSLKKMDGVLRGLGSLKAVRLSDILLLDIPGINDKGDVFPKLMTSFTAGIQTVPSVSSSSITQLETYLKQQRNISTDIERFKQIMKKYAGRIVLEIGCGNTFLASEMALEHPELAVIAIDEYSDDIRREEYRQSRMLFKNRVTSAQKQYELHDNVVVLKASHELLNFWPSDLKIAGIMFNNPDPGLVSKVAQLGNRLDDLFLPSAGEKIVVNDPYRNHSMQLDDWRKNYEGDSLEILNDDTFINAHRRPDAKVTPHTKFMSMVIADYASHVYWSWKNRPQKKVLLKIGIKAATSSSATGGIDLDGDYLDIDTRRRNSAVGTRFIAPSKTENIEGFTFTISQIREYQP